MFGRHTHDIKPPAASFTTPRYGTIVACWLLIGLAWAPAVYLMDPTRQGLPVFVEATVLSVASFVPWMLVTPLILHACSVVDLRRHPLRDGVLLAIAVVFALPILAASGRLIALFIAITLGSAASFGTGADWIRAVTITSLFALPTALAVVAIGLVLAASRRARERERMLAAARLNALRSELNPHFLFNSLGGIAQLAHQSPDAAERAIASLADIMRATLAEKRHLRPLGDEVSSLRDHLDLHAALVMGVGLDLRVDPAAWHALVPSHILTPLVENATTHGHPAADGSFVITIEAARKSDQLLITIRNPCLALAPSSAGLGSGIGNVRERLTLLFGRSASVTSTRGEGIFSVTMKLPIVLSGNDG